MRGDNVGLREERERVGVTWRGPNMGLRESPLGRGGSGDVRAPSTSRRYSERSCVIAGSCRILAQPDQPEEGIGRRAANALSRHEDRGRPAVLRQDPIKFTCVYTTWLADGNPRRHARARGRPVPGMMIHAAGTRRYRQQQWTANGGGKQSMHPRLAFMLATVVLRRGVPHEALELGHDPA
eukprot:364344-Chlamydomonas_euryale.AAC.15